jgi:hypothetical protein
MLVPHDVCSLFRGVMAIMDRIVRVGLSENAILILMHVVIFSADGLQLSQRHFVEQVQIEYLNLLYRWETLSS